MASRAGSVVLALLGAVLLVASLFQTDGNDVYAVGLLVFGSGLVVLGVVLPRLLNAVVGGSSVDPGSGLATGDGFDALLLMAQEVARVLVDLLQWFPD